MKADVGTYGFPLKVIIYKKVVMTSWKALFVSSLGVGDLIVWWKRNLGLVIKSTCHNHHSWLGNIFTFFLPPYINAKDIKLSSMLSIITISSTSLENATDWSLKTHVVKSQYCLLLKHVINIYRLVPKTFLYNLFI